MSIRAASRMCEIAACASAESGPRVLTNRFNLRVSGTMIPSPVVNVQAKPARPKRIQKLFQP